MSGVFKWISLPLFLPRKRWLCCISFEGFGIDWQVQGKVLGRIGEILIDFRWTKLLISPPDLRNLIFSLNSQQSFVSISGLPWRFGDKSGGFSVGFTGKNVYWTQKSRILLNRRDGIRPKIVKSARDLQFRYLWHRLVGFEFVKLQHLHFPRKTGLFLLRILAIQEKLSFTDEQLNI